MAVRFMSGSAVLMFVVNDVVFFPVVDPIVGAEYQYIAVFSRAEDACQSGIDDHFFADETWDGIDSPALFDCLSGNIDITAKKTDSRSCGVDDCILFGMNASAEFISVSVGYVEFVTETGAVLKTGFGFPWSADITCGNNLIIADDDGTDRAAEACASFGHFLGNS
jgi:hypothetical protein